MAVRLIDDVFDALDEQTVVVPGTGTLDIVVPSLARSLGAVHEQRRALEVQINTLLEEQPLSPVPISIPGGAVRTAAVLLVTVGDGTSFPTAARLASYVALAPTTKSSGTSIHGEHAPRGGNRQLKRAVFLSAFAALQESASRTYYDTCLVDPDVNTFPLHAGKRRWSPNHDSRHRRHMPAPPVTRESDHVAHRDRVYGGAHRCRRPPSHAVVVGLADPAVRWCSALMRWASSSWSSRTMMRQAASMGVPRSTSSRARAAMRSW
jgi:hypothetical protein